jgi:amidohydrolase
MAWRQPWKLSLFTEVAGALLYTTQSMVSSLKQLPKSPDIYSQDADALPGIGHACGHNLIATSSIAAFIATCEAMKAQAQTSGIPGFTVRLLGTPAEESGGGKVKLIEAGAYKNVDACLMVHPVPMSPNHPDVHGIATVVEGGYLANNKVKVTFTGKPSHAAAAPWEGINALDAVVSAYVNISLLRQQILPSQKIHGVIVNGGARPNIIPMSASVDYYIRSPTKKSLKPLTERVVKCFEAAATATGCKVEYEWFELSLLSATSIWLIENFQGRQL